MPGIVLFTVIVVIIVIVLLFLHDAKRARAASPAPVEKPQQPPKAAEPNEDPLKGVDVDALAGHVRGLRRAVEEGLIGREEAIASIVRQAEGKVGEGVAEELLDRADLD